MRPNLLIAGILNLIVGASWVVMGTMDNNVTLAIGAFIIVTGIIFIMYSRMQIQEVVSKRSTILTLSIFLLPLNFISAIILAVEYDLIKRDYARYKLENNIQSNETSTEKVQVAKEVKKVDVLLKIGVAMVAIAGTMIVTTSWEALTDVIKLILLIVIGFVFFGLAKFSEIKLKIRNTTLAYWLLSMISFGLAVFLIGYAELLGNWFSFAGEGEDAFMASFALIIAGMSYLTYRKFSINSFIYLAYASITLSVIFILRQLGQEPTICVLIVALILLVINVLPKSEKKEIKIVKNFSMIITYILTAFVLSELKNITEDVIVIANFIVQIASLITIGLREKNETTKVLSSLSVIILTSVASTYLLTDLELVYKMVITRGIFVAMSVLISAVIIRDSKINNLFLGIALPLVLLSIITEIHLAVALFVGCIALAMIIFGAIKKDYKVIFIEGIIFTILNLIIQLWDLWDDIPFSIYLLLGGFILIGIVTFKELRKNKSNTEVKVNNNVVETKVVDSVESSDNNVKVEVIESKNEEEK